MKVRLLFQKSPRHQERRALWVTPFKILIKTRHLCWNHLQSLPNIKVENHLKELITRMKATEDTTNLIAKKQVLPLEWCTCANQRQIIQSYRSATEKMRYLLKMKTRMREIPN